MFSSSGFFCSIIAFALEIASFSKSLSLILVPSLVDIFPVGNSTIPNATCSNPLVYFSSKPSNLATSNTCLKCSTCSYEVIYNALSKSYVRALYIIAAKSLVAYVDEPLLFSIMHGVFIPLSSKSIILAPSDSTNFPVLLRISITSGILSE